jgi:hypothetical protein
MNFPSIFIVLTILCLCSHALGQLNDQFPIAELNITSTESTAPISFANEFLKRSLAPPEAKIDSFIWAGPGCTGAESLYAEFDDKSGAFSYFTPRFSILSGSKTPSPTDSRKQCTVSFTLSYPSGWQYSLGGAESKGYAGFSAGSVLVQGSYWFSGISDTVILLAQ